ncbi:MAG: glycine/betaine ABC transporter ATP-binding protein, partial [Candidatus Limnocylindrales bacterium]
MTARAERPGPDGEGGRPTLSVRNLWKLFGPAEHKVIGTPDADLSRDDLRRKTGSMVAIRDVSFDVHPGEVFVVMGL